MTIGQVVGVIGGAILGYFTGGAGWYLAGAILMGASAGYAVGSLVDPTGADTQSPGQPEIGELAVPSCTEGILVADLIGTSKLVGNIFWYGGSRNEPIIQETESGGKGGGSKTTETTVGYKYYLSWSVGLCLGPADELLAVYQGEDLLWSGSLVRPAGGYSSVTLKEMGTCYIYFGTDDQPASARMDQIIGGDLNPALRNFCYAVMDDCYIGNYNRAPRLSFVLRKTPTYAWSDDERVGLYEYNPAHGIYYIVDRHTEIPASMMNDAVFAATAETLGLEMRGISALIASERDAMQYIETILTHIGGIFHYGNDSLFQLKLLRGGDSTDGLPSLSEEDFVEEPSVQRRTYVETYNEVKVQYAERTEKGTPSVFRMGFIDEATGQAVDGTHGYTWAGSHCPNAGYAEGTPLEQWTDDYNQYVPGGALAAKPWLHAGAEHITALVHVDMSRGYICPVMPDNFGSLPGVYLDFYNASGTETTWSTNVALWQAQFQAMIAATALGIYIPGSVLHVWLDSSSMGGIAVLEPAYSQFKAWVVASYGNLLYIEEEDGSEEWIRLCHYDLTSKGYGG